MKTTVSCIILLFLVVGINAQEIKMTNHTAQANEKTVITKETNSNASSKKALKTEISIEDDTCYSEISKATFYEALLRQSGLKIHLKNNDLALKNTEDIITNKKNRISYSE